MPRPPVLVGQVWRFIDVRGENFISIVSTDTIPVLPPGSDLVWGPFAPWQDTSVKVEK